MSQCYTTFDLKINLGHSDLYFMVQWILFFYFLLWKTFYFYWQSLIQASYAVLRQLLLYLQCFVKNDYCDVYVQLLLYKKE